MSPLSCIHAFCPQTGAVKPQWNVTGELPCDIHMVTLRTMLESPPASPLPGQDPPATSHHTSHSPSPLTALMLHRLGFDCAFKSPGLSCSTNGGKVTSTVICWGGNYVIYQL